MANVMVTGGCGFIGSAIVNRLHAQGHKVHIIDNLSLGHDHWEGQSNHPVLHVGDVLDPAMVERVLSDVRSDIVFHMAAHHYIPYCEKNPYEAYRLNVTGTLNVLEACRKTGIRKFFFASTGDVYPPSFSPHRETDMVAPIYIYGHTKYLGEQLCNRYFSTVLSGSSVIIGRIFNAAGPRETNPHLIPEVVRQIGEGKRMIEVGNLWPKRDFVDVESMAEIIVELTNSAEGVEVVNIGSGNVQEIGTVLDLIARSAPKPIEIVSVASRQRPNDRPYLCPDVTRLKRLVGRAARSFDADTVRSIFAELARTRQEQP
jgi:UDP-glucose 4-epimerase